MKKPQASKKKSNDLARAKKFPEMKSWDSPAHRLKALEKFVADLNALTSTQVEAFVKSPKNTKMKFAECGPFYVEGVTNPNYPPWTPQSKKVKIPKKTKFRVFRNGNPDDRKKRDERVVLIVNPLEINEDENLGAAQAWRCTYSPYVGEPTGGAPYSKIRRRSK